MKFSYDLEGLEAIRYLLIYFGKYSTCQLEYVFKRSENHT